MLGPSNTKDPTPEPPVNDAPEDLAQPPPLLKQEGKAEEEEKKRPRDCSETEARSPPPLLKAEPCEAATVAKGPATESVIGQLLEEREAKEMDIKGEGEAGTSETVVSSAPTDLSGNAEAAATPTAATTPSTPGKFHHDGALFIMELTGLVSYVIAAQE